MNPRRAHPWQCIESNAGMHPSGRGPSESKRQDAVRTIRWLGRVPWLEAPPDREGSGNPDPFARTR